MFIFNTGRKILLLKQVSLWVSNLISFPRFFFLLKNFCLHLISSADFISCVAMHIAPRKALPSELWSTGVSPDFRGLEKRKLCVFFCCCDVLFAGWLLLTPCTVTNFSPHLSLSAVKGAAHCLHLYNSVFQMGAKCHKGPMVV